MYINLSYSDFWLKKKNYYFTNVKTFIYISFLQKNNDFANAETFIYN